jgi:hypothetical protein
MPRPRSDWIRRALLLAVIALPLLVGAIYVGIKPGFDATDRTPKVALVAPANQPDTSPSSRLAAALSNTPGFEWQVRDADSAASGLSSGRLLAAVTIPEKFGDHSGADDASTHQVTVTPGRQDLDAPTYAALVQQVSAAANKIGVGDLLVAVSKAQGDLSHAQFTATVIRAAAGEANDQFVNAFASVDKLIKQATPVMASAKTMLATLDHVSGQVDQIAGMLAMAGSSTRSINLTIGDIQSGATNVGHGADATADALQATEPFRAQVRTVISPIATALQFSGIPDAQRMAAQLNSLLTLVGGPSDQQAAGQLHGVGEGAALVATQLDNLSSLLDAKVDAHTQISDVLTLGANRLRTLSAFMAQGRTTINQVLGQVSQATGQLPSMEAGVKTQLQQFQNVTAQLVTSLNAGTKALPQTNASDPAAGAGDTVTVSDAAAVPGGLSADSVARAVLVLLIGALLVALGRAWLAERLHGRGGLVRYAADAAAVIVAVAVAGIGLAVLGSVPRADSAFVVLVLGALALTALAVAVLRLLGDKIGIIVMACLIGATVILSSGLHGQHNAIARFVARLLPSSYATTGLGDAAALGIGPAVTLPIVILAAVGVLATAAVALTPKKA